MRVKDTKTFIEKAKSVHGDTYDYSLVEYVDTRTKVEIVCSKHGSFMQTPHGHLCGGGCTKCGVIKYSSSNRKSTDNFIADAKKVHNNKYNYSLVEYVNSRTKVKIVCVKHGLFLATPNAHISSKSGCPSCGKYSQARKKGTVKFIADAKKVHGNRYDYSLVEYVNSDTKVKIVCKDHGVFEQNPQKHSNLKRGCPKCGVIKRSLNRRKSTDEFIGEVKKVHGDKYIYDKTEYKLGKGEIIITCREHGDFIQVATDHLSGRGCPKCSKSARKDLKYFLESAKKVHGNKYDYSKVDFKNTTIKVKIVCREHGSFCQTPEKHLIGQGCSLCGKYGFQNDSPGKLYYLRVTDGENVAYKIGITNRSVDERYNLNELSKIEVLMELDYAVGRNAYKREQEILKEFKSEKWDGVDLLKSGNTELFKTDVLGLDK